MQSDRANKAVTQTNSVRELSDMTALLEMNARTSPFFCDESMPYRICEVEPD
ncbi:hypothetical protein LIMNO130_30306 [Limnobacter sp. 130]|nr:hypothetical protein LIMNO130_30306 [Limnobacter sp. 130]